MEAVSQLLKNYRSTHEPPLTRTQAAEKVGVSRATWFRWESASEKSFRKIDPDKLPKVSEVTGIPAKELRPDLMNLLADVSEDQ